ncbi:MAG: ABC transporter permease [Gammaproteobacteria bacterium]
MLFKSLVTECSAELLKALRAPEYMIPTLVFPVAFYTFFGVIMPQGPSASAYLLATYGVFAVMGPAVFGFGVAVANERDRGWLDLKRASPAPGMNYILAKIVVTLLVASLSIALVYAVAGFAAGVALPRLSWVQLFLTHLLATLPFILIGLIIGFCFGANAAVAIANLAFMGLAILGGLWIPITMYPSVMQSLAQVLPSYHLGEIALYVAGASGEHTFTNHVVVMIITTVVLAALTLLAWSRQRD